jgi:signal transduction histidine kinase
MEEILLLVDEDGLVLGANRAVSRWGLGDLTLVNGRSFHQVIHPGCDEPDCYLHFMWQCLLDPTRAAGRIEREIADDILDRWLYVSLETIMPPENEALAQLIQPFAMLEFRDVTKLRQKREMERRQTRFEAFNFALRGLVHEVGNPLAAMWTTLEVLRSNLNNFSREKTLAYLDRVLEGTERLQAIVDQNSRLSKDPDLHLSDVPLRHLFERMKRLFEDEFKAQGIHFKIGLPASSEYPQLLLDLTAMEEVIVNIIKNAREPPSRAIPLACRIALTNPAWRS